MNCTKLVLGAVVVASTLLTGCVSNGRFDDYTKANDAKVAQLSSDVASLRADVQAAKDDAARANMRLDNMAKGHYKK